MLSAIRSGSVLVGGVPLVLAVVWGLLLLGHGGVFPATQARVATAIVTAVVTFLLVFNGVLTLAERWRTRT